MMRTVCAVAFLGLACAAPSRTTAPASGTASAAPARKDTGAVATSPLICRTERPTGSNYPRRVCYRQEDLDATSQAAQDAHRRATSSNAQIRRE